MRSSLRDPLVIEVHDPLAQVEILEQRGSAFPGGERVVGVLHAESLRRCQTLTRLGPRLGAGVGRGRVLGGRVAPPSDAAKLRSLDDSRLLRST